MSSFRHKKNFGQHFLTDENVAFDIVQGLIKHSPTKQILEIGPGEGVLTKYLLKEDNIELFISEIDNDIIPIIQEKFGVDKNHLIHGDFLVLDFDNYFPNEFSIIGNFPYNISTEIIFRVIENRVKVPMVVGMFQKEVAERFAAKSGNKTYGITSVLTQAFYDIEYLFTVNENVFNPPPKVKSGVIRMTRKPVYQLPVNEKLFFTVVKTAFNQRRKTLRNALKSLSLQPDERFDAFFEKRAEQLSVEKFIELTSIIQEQKR